ncbi:hypothetical protein V2J09_016977 [Rumex salicifolius]
MESQAIREEEEERTTADTEAEKEEGLTKKMKDLNLKMSSPETKLGMQVGDLWDVQEQQLTPTEKLNACFEEIPVSSFPRAALSSVEIDSETSLPEAVRVLVKHKLLSAPVVDSDAPKDATWFERYLGVVEFAGIVVWILQQAEADDDLGEALASACQENNSSSKDFSPKSQESPNAFSPKAYSPTALSAASNGTRLARLGSLSPRAAAVISGNFFGALTSSEFYKNAKVRDISGSFRWAPFLALQKSNSMLTVLLLLSKYKMKSVPVVDIGGANIENIITQSAVIHMLAECVELRWFENWGNKMLSELGLPVMNREQMIEVYQDEPVLQAFKLMRLKGVGGVPVLDRDGRKAVGNISIRDVQFLLTAPNIYKDYRSITVEDFLVAARNYREKHGELLPTTSGMHVITCKKNTPLKETILTLDTKNIHRIYVVDDEGNLEGVITLRDIISRLVHEPHGYFGDFFDGYAPNWRG